MTENQFRDRHIIPWLKTLARTFFFIKEAHSVRGYPDLICCINGKFVGIEIKKNEAELNDPRHALQKYRLTQIEWAGGYGYTVYPENWGEIKRLLLASCFSNA